MHRTWLRLTVAERGCAPRMSSTDAAPRLSPSSLPTHPIGNDPSYVVQVSVQADDGLGNGSTTPLTPAFTVTFCQ
jgi:hypothetical protein